MTYDAYIAGPMSGLPDLNFPAFHRVHDYLRGQYGWECFNPAENLDGATDAPRSEYMRLDFEAILASARIVFLPGWEQSRGAVAEFTIARELDLPAYLVNEPGNSIARLSYENLTVNVVRESSGTGPIRHMREAERLVYGNREDSYGHPFDDFSRTAGIWSALLGVDVTPEQVALCMVGVKLSRETNQPKDDNVVDAHGYLLTYGRVRDRRREMEAT